MNRRPAIDHTTETFNVDRVREEFPILTEKIYGNPLVYFDNAATSQKPLSVIRAVDHYYRHQNANIHRGVHHLSNISTEAYEESRRNIRMFLNAGKDSEIIYTRGATESINLVARSYVRKIANEGDEILISAMEHHSNIVPWQLLCQEKKCVLKVIPMDRQGNLLTGELHRLISDRTVFLSVTHISNALGTVNEIRKIIELAHSRGIKVLVDGAQSIPHIKVDVREMDCDFFVFSGHKVYGPTGIGILYGKENLLDQMDPYQGGGDMIRSVTFEKTTYNDLPYKFEAGTPNIAGAIGLGAAVDFVRRTGIEAIAAHETELLVQATKDMKRIEGVRIIGEAKKKAGVISFIIDSIHPHDIGTIFDQDGIAIRTGHHCSQPVMDFFGIPATARISFACYNKREEIEILMRSLKKIKEVFG